MSFKYVPDFKLHVILQYLMIIPFSNSSPGLQLLLLLPENLLLSVQLIKRSTLQQRISTSQYLFCMQNYVSTYSLGIAAELL